MRANLWLDSPQFIAGVERMGFKIGMERLIMKHTEGDR